MAEFMGSTYRVLTALYINNDTRTRGRPPLRPRPFLRPFPTSPGCLSHLTSLPPSSRPTTILLLPETFTPGKWLADIAGLRVRLECREDGGRIGFKEAVATEIYWKTIGSCKRIFITRPRWTLANGALLEPEFGRGLQTLKKRDFARTGIFTGFEEV